MSDVESETHVDKTDSVIEYMKYAHSRIDEMKNSIYLRASIVIVALAFLAPQGTTVIAKLLETGKNNLLALVLGIAIGVPFLIAILGSSLYAVFCLAPLKSMWSIYEILTRSATGSTSLDKIPVYTAFPHITSMTRENFESSVTKLTDVDVLSQLTSAIYTLSHLTERRYTRLRRAYACLITAVAAFITLTVVHIVISR